ncbi:hypothetical protein C1645_741536 [Glomus cerebriforme]|uniref:Uncharacterized protein n=1 Tax=Glomus cerebriforme TaxID=658196 RepID=A0A397SGX2_9GLOM|nr:hypothetical protein C1645_741536 [Glomus cerebriforme]
MSDDEREKRHREVSSSGSSSNFGGKYFADCAIKNDDSRRHLSWGLNLEGHCKNTSCRAYGQSERSIFGWGFRNGGKFNLFENGHECKCPLCGEYMQAITCGFFNTQWLIRGRRITDPSKPLEDFRNPKYGWNCVLDNEYEHPKETFKIVPWGEDFIIEVKSL